ncbi:hypothetical protein PAHAL_6G253600 [Panicum hallii]|uniref:Uncharacterized protein n=1 Tax=Panicum hallii TaxID=206008 RepID=A0A2T8IHI3_9POAL|nr:hypothetical protein PAHAL_6G253600 [Panicum hallii]
MAFQRNPANGEIPNFNTYSSTAIRQPDGRGRGLPSSDAARHCFPRLRSLGSSLDSNPTPGRKTRTERV